MANSYFSAELGGIPLLIATIETTDGRDVAVLSPSRGNKHTLRDRGRKHRATTCELVFIDQPGQAPYLDRFDAVRALVDQPGSVVFSHPLLGTYRVRIADFDHQADMDNLMVSVSCTLYAEDEPQVVFQSGAGVSAAAGVEAVSVAAGAADEALADVGLSSDAPAACAATVQGWSDADEVDPQQVFLEAASRVEELNDAIASMSSDLAAWPAYRALCLLRYQVGRAAEAFTSESEQLLEMTVIRDTPLLAICAEVYPASIAVERARQVAMLNRIRTPGRVPAGTTLKLPATGAR